MEQGGEALTSAFTPLGPGALLAESVVLPETWEQPSLCSSCDPTAMPVLAWSFGHWPSPAVEAGIWIAPVVPQAAHSEFIRHQLLF